MKEKKDFKPTTTILFFLIFTHNSLPTPCFKVGHNFSKFRILRLFHRRFYSVVQFPFKFNNILCANSTVSSCVEGNCAKKIKHTGCELNQWKLSLQLRFH